VPEEVRLHVHLLDGQLPAPIRRWIHWCDRLNRRVCQPWRPGRFPLHAVDLLRVRQLSASGISTAPGFFPRIVAIACCAAGWGYGMTAKTSSRGRAPLGQVSRGLATPYFRATSSACSACG
jgi:hypothetical protein